MEVVMPWRRFHGIFSAPRFDSQLTTPEDVSKPAASSASLLLAVLEGPKVNRQTTKDLTKQLPGLETGDGWNTIL